MESNLDVVRGATQQSRGLLRIELLDIPQQQHAAVRLGQTIDALADLGADFVALQRGDDLVVPLARGERVMAGLIECREKIVDRYVAAARLAPQFHQANVHHDPMQPGSNAGVALE